MITTPIAAVVAVFSVSACRRHDARDVLRRMAHERRVMCRRCQSNAPSWSFVFVDGVDKLEDRHALIKMTPQQEPWGLREMHVADRDGSVIRFLSEGDHG